MTKDKKVLFCQLIKTEEEDCQLQGPVKPVESYTSVELAVLNKRQTSNFDKYINNWRIFKKF